VSTSVARAVSDAGSLCVERLREVVLSIYLYNERRGYQKLELLEAELRRARPEERTLADAVAHHVHDERRHYRMFRAWFVRRGVMPFRIDPGAGYVDRLVRALEGVDLDGIDMAAAVRDDAKLERLFRLIVLTERRGLAQVRALLRFAPMASDPTLRAMFEVVERDEPSHFEPYQAWLARRGRAEPSARERVADLAAHLSIVWLRLPGLVLDLRVPRMEQLDAPA
jgi:hypothetical protein